MAPVILALKCSWYRSQSQDLWLLCLAYGLPVPPPSSQSCSQCNLWSRLKKGYQPAVKNSILPGNGARVVHKVSNLKLEEKWKHDDYFAVKWAGNLAMYTVTPDRDISRSTWTMSLRGTPLTMWISLNYCWEFIASSWSQRKLSPKLTLTYFRLISVDEEVDHRPSSKFLDIRHLRHSTCFCSSAPFPGFSEPFESFLRNRWPSSSSLCSIASTRTCMI